MLLAIPVAVFVLPALLGHPAVAGDNLLQNYPLRVLAGQELRAGHWPLWNPYADSGTPLLGGMNAGALYPGTLLFAVLPGLVAWVANLVVVYWVAAIGLYALARTLGVRPVASGIAAATYAYGGAMVGQLIHLGVIQGQALLPWLVLSAHSLARAVLAAPHPTRARALARGALPSVLALAGIVGLVCLTGEPRSMADAAIVLLVVAACELLAHGATARATARGRVAFGVATVVGAAWGIAIGAVQLAPGWSFIGLSERAQIPYGFFAAGSLSPRMLLLLLVQGVLGTNGVLGTPQYFGGYNLPEVTVYVGLASLTAVAAFAAQLPGRRARAPRRALCAFLALVVVGAVLAVGPNTALGPLLHDVPLLGRTRLQSRNLALLDLGAAVLLAWWLDAVLDGRRAEASLTRWRAPITLAPVGATAALCVAALVSPSWVTEALLAVPRSAPAAAAIRGTVVVSLVLCAAFVGALWWRGASAGTAVRRRGPGALLVAVVLVDLVSFNVLFETGLISGTASVVPSDVAAVEAFGTSGRHAIVDPAVLDYHEVVPLGFANLNVFTEQPSVQGYGSLHAGRYADATGTHLLGRLDGCALARGTFVALRLSAIAAATNSLVSTPPNEGATSPCAQRPATAVRRYFGAVVHVERLTLEGAPTRNVEVRLLDAHGAAMATATVLARRGALVASFPAAPPAAGVEVAATRPFTLTATTLRARGSPVERLDTWLQVGLQAAGWRLVDVDGPISYFRVRAVRPAAWLAGDPGGTARVLATSPAGSVSLSVRTARSATLVWSEAWLPGWVATATSSSGAVRALRVRPEGLVQRVEVPPGAWTVVLSYRAPWFAAGLLTSAVAVLALLVGLVALLATGVVARRRAASTRGPASPDAGEPGH